MGDIGIPEVIAFFKQKQLEYPIKALGVGAFGPVDNNPASLNYGTITSTPKLEWRDFNIRQALLDALGINIVVDTDVNIAALAEYKWGAGLGCNNFVYLTIGTGIGGSAFVGGKPLRGISHAEMGHMFIPIQANDHYPGFCHYHKNCLEGLACGEAIKARWQVDSAMDLPPSHPAWQLEAEYLAYAVANLCWLLSPEKVIMGGGVMKQTQLYRMIQQRLPDKISGYLLFKQYQADYNAFIVPPSLDSQAGIKGALALCFDL